MMCVFGDFQTQMFLGPFPHATNDGEGGDQSLPFGSVWEFLSFGLKPIKQMKD